MAKVLESFAFGRGRYDYTKWLDGQVWQLTAGEDFDIKASSMRANILSNAAKRGLQCQTHLNGDVLTVRASKPE